jgi:AraC family transcriptional regulator, regulatory protein of adaptative response / methylated-DNA-[protein]-cysteine methyltransferase
MKPTIYFDVKESIFGASTTIAHTQQGICAVLFGPRWDPDEELQKMFPKHDLQWVYSPQYALKIIKQLEDDDSLNKLAIDLQCGTPFQKLVWQTLHKVPHGSRMTYSELASKLGMPRAVRAVASAVANNPISIIIPCHRIVPKGGGIGKYRWGVEMKKKLLEREEYQQI